MGLKTKLMLGVGLLFVLTACGDDNDSNSSNTGTSPGVCNITKNVVDALCLTLSSTVSNENASDYCSQTFYPVYVNSIGANGYGFVSILLDGDISCVDANEIGTCQMSAGVITYYNTEYNVTSAENDCVTNHSGTWQETP